MTQTTTSAASRPSGSEPSRARAGAPLRRALVPVAVALLVWSHLARGWFPWSCPFALATHHPCPTCGLTRAAREVLRLHLARATQLNPLACVVLPFVALFVAGELAGFVATGRFGWLARRRPVRLAGFVLCAALFAVWVARFFGAFGGPVDV